MSLITQALWSADIPGEMPEGCTYQMYCAAREVVWAEQDRALTLRCLESLEQLTETRTPIVEHWVQKQRKLLMGELE